MSAYRATVPVEVAEALRAPVRDTVLDILRHDRPLLEAQAEPCDGGVAFVLRIDTDHESDVVRKAIYWLKRATDKLRGINWTGALAGPVEVEPWD